MNNIPRAAWPDIRKMYIVDGMTRKQIADHYGTTLHRIVTALRHMNCTLPMGIARQRHAERMKFYNYGRKRGVPAIIRPASPYSMTGLITAASMVMRYSTNDIKAHRRHRPMFRVRWAIWYLAQDHFSFSKIGKVFDRDHTTVIYGCTQALQLMESDSAFRDMVAAIRNEALRAKERQRIEISQLVERIAA